MKPIPVTICNDRRLDSFDRAVGKPCPPITDYNYHLGAFQDSSAQYASIRVRPFWNMTDDYFKHEARHDFWSEAALFAIITVTAALPLINNLHALIEFVRAITPQ